MGRIRWNLPGLRRRVSERWRLLLKRSIAALLPLALLLPMGGSTRAARGDTGFTDVQSGAWYASTVTYCQRTGLMHGVSLTRFAPEQQMSRAMLAASLHRASGSTATGEGKDFTDLIPDAWYAESVRWARENGLFTGYADGRFGPDEPITREQLATVLWRASNCPAPAASLLAFSDAAAVSPWAQTAVAWAVGRGIMRGRPDGSFAPLATATRAEVATVLALYYGAELAPPPSPLRPNPYRDADFVVQDGFLTYQGEGAVSLVGVDVSAHQGEIDWARVAASGVDFAMIRAGYRGYSAGKLYQDEYFVRNIEGALAAGLDVGVYVFSQATSVEEALEEAEALLDWIAGYELRFPVVFDWERIGYDSARTDAVDIETVTACAAAFCERVEQAGYLPMTYASPFSAFTDIDLAQLADYPFWLAHYTKDWAPSFFAYDFQMWQYTSSGHVDGIEGEVDLNLCLTDF